MEFTFLTKPVKRRQFLHSVATEFSNCKMSFTPNLLQKLLFSPKPLVSLLGGCGGVSPQSYSTTLFYLFPLPLPEWGVQGVSPWLILFSSCFNHYIAFYLSPFSFLGGGSGGYPPGYLGLPHITNTKTTLYKSNSLCLPPWWVSCQLGVYFLN